MLKLDEKRKRGGSSLLSLALAEPELGRVSVFVALGELVGWGFSVTFHADGDRGGLR